MFKDINSNKYEISEYFQIKIYFSNKKEIITLIKREFYVINNLTIKTFIEINIIKSKRNYSRSLNRYNKN